MSDRKVLESLVEKKLNKLKVSKSEDPDGFYSLILSELSRSIKSILEGQLREAWKDVYITPIDKNGSKTTPGKYRSLNLTSVIGKVMELV